MDIEVRGIQVFRVLEVIEVVPEKLYSGAIVAAVAILDHHETIAPEFTELTHRNYLRCSILKMIYAAQFMPCVHSVFGHYVGMDLIDEYEISNIPRNYAPENYCGTYQKILPRACQIAGSRGKTQRTFKPVAFATGFLCFLMNDHFMACHRIYVWIHLCNCIHR